MARRKSPESPSPESLEEPLPEGAEVAPEGAVDPLPTPEPEDTGSASHACDVDGCTYVGPSEAALAGHRGGAHRRGRKAPQAAVEAADPGDEDDNYPVFQAPDVLASDSRWETLAAALASVGAEPRLLKSLAFFWRRTSIAQDPLALLATLSRNKTVGIETAHMLVSLVFPSYQPPAAPTPWGPTPGYTLLPGGAPSQPALSQADIDKAVSGAIALERERSAQEARIAKLEEQLEAAKSARAAPAPAVGPSPDVEALKAQVAALSASLNDKRTQEQIAAAVTPVLAELKALGQQKSQADAISDAVSRTVKAMGTPGLSAEGQVAVATINAQLAAFTKTIDSAKDAYALSVRGSHPMSPGGSPTQAASAEELARAGLGSAPAVHEERDYPGGRRWGDSAEATQ